MSDSIIKIQKKLGYKKDTSDTYKSMTNYYDEYQPYLRDNQLYSDLTYKEFKKDLAHREGQAEKFQKFADLMQTDGYNLGMAKSELNMSFDEVSIAMHGLVREIDFSYFDTEYNEIKRLGE